MPIRLRSLPLAPLLTAIPAFVVLFGFGMVAPDVLTTGNLWNIATQTSYLAIFTLGQTIVLLTARYLKGLGYRVTGFTDPHRRQTSPGQGPARPAARSAGSAAPAPMAHRLAA